MSFLSNLIERIPEGIQRTGDTIIGTPSRLASFQGARAHISLDRPGQSQSYGTVRTRIVGLFV